MKEIEASEPLLLDGVTPDAILKDPTLSAGARLLWIMLAEYQGKLPECYPSQEMLAVPLGVKVRQLQSFIKELESYTRGDPPEPFPLIEVKLVFVEKDRKTRNIYKLLRWPFLAFDLKANGAERSHLADEGDAQYSAHRSGSDTRDRWTAPPATPGKDGGVTPDGMRDTQSSAHQSERLMVEYAKFREAEALRLFDALPALVLRGLNDKKQNLLRQEGRLDRMALDVRRREVKNLILLDIEREQVMPFADWVEPKRKSGTST